MSGETDPVRLLRDMAPVLTAGTWVFAHVPRGTRLPTDLDPLGRFREAEGETLIVERAAAERADLAFEFPCRRITLTIHSDLAAVGLLAAVARCLADAGIPANTVSAFHHDHVFVPEHEAEHALTVLRQCAAAHNPHPNPSP